MRWDNLRLDEPTSTDASASDAAVPLFARNAVTRTFDTPGFRGMTFYEVQAKSIVSRVPAASRMPFKWTINPYRGCQHACTYCVQPDTPILLASGHTKRIADVQVGDKIYGTVRDGFYRHYTVTTVLAHWSTVKPAYRITLKDGTQLVASDDHRFLTERGWKHVTGAEQGPLQRPFLTTNNKLMGVGGFAEGPKDCVDYRRGYLCGMIRGDANIHSGIYQRRNGGTYEQHHFRLALADYEALSRTRHYLGTFAILTSESDFTLPTETRRPMRAIRVSRRGEVQAIQHQISWPTAPSEDWYKGFLAGIFDAEGSYSCGVWRVSNTDPEIIEWTTRALSAFDFEYVLEPPKGANHLVVVRMRGGLPEVMRFFHTTDPAITRKRSIDGVAIKSNAELRITSIEPLGLEIPMYDITTGTGDFVANGVVSHNCFARNTHTYLDLDSGQDFDSKVVVKVNAPELLRAKLASPGWAGEHIAMGTNVDCYQRAEGRYQLMRGIIGALRDAANPFSILTKGTLILRDLDLLLEAAEVTDVGLNVSAGFVDKDLWRAIEPGTPAPQRRLDACATLADSGLGCGVLMGPVVPYLSDSPAQLESAVRQVAAAGAAHVTPIVLHLRPGTREWFMGWLREAHPRLLPRYAELYGRGAYAPRQYQERITGQVRELARKHGVGRRGGPRHGNPRAIMTEPTSAQPAGPSVTPLVAHEQLTLLLPVSAPSNAVAETRAVTGVTAVTRENNDSVPGWPLGTPGRSPRGQACLKTFDLFVLRALEPRRRTGSARGRYPAGADRKWLPPSTRSPIELLGIGGVTLSRVRWQATGDAGEYCPMTIPAELIAESAVDFPGPPLGAAELSTAEAERMATVFKALADPVRLRLFSRLAAHQSGEACVCDIQNVGVSQPTVSHHLKKLREAGLITSERRGTWVYCRVAPGVLSAMARMLAPEG